MIHLLQLLIARSQSKWVGGDLHFKVSDILALMEKSILCEMALSK